VGVAAERCVGAGDPPGNRRRVANGPQHGRPGNYRHAASGPPGDWRDGRRHGNDGLAANRASWAQPLAAATGNAIRVDTG
jgi:hypothetical protein